MSCKILILNIMNYIQNLGYIGQKEHVGRLNNYIHAERSKKHFLPPIALFGPRGFGKTELAKSIGACLLLNDGLTPKDFIEIQGSGVKSKRWFIDNIIIRHLNVGPCTLFIDEVHDMPIAVKNWIMPLLYPNREGVVEISDDNQDYILNYNQISIIIATTDSHRLSQAFVSRCQRFDLGPYEYEELALIAKRGLDGICITDEVMPHLVKCGRNTPRMIVNLINNLRIWSSNNDVEVINLSAWKDFGIAFGVKPLGVTRNEVEYLKYLSQSRRTLTMLASKLKLDPSTVREDIESYLIDEDLIVIDGERSITTKGQVVLQDILAQEALILEKKNQELIITTENTLTNEIAVE